MQLSGPIPALRERATKLYDEISLRAHTSRVAQPEAFQAAFDSLELGQCDDPATKALFVAMKPLQSWAGNDAGRLETVYSTALRVAGQAIGGLPGAALGGCKDETLLASLTGLGSEAGGAAQPFLENLVPESWTEGQGTDAQWRVGQSLNMVREGRADNVRFVNSTWLAHKSGEKLSAAEVDIAVGEIATFGREKTSQGWRPTASGLRHLEGERITFLSAHEGRLVPHEGTVENVHGALFGLAGTDEQFNANYCHSMLQADSPRLRYFEGLDPQQRLLIDMGFAHPNY
ncbi:MAG: hypothetical protein AB7S38_39465 [Vulcanimicrobiota bacterium]